MIPRYKIALSISYFLPANSPPRSLASEPKDIRARLPNKDLIGVPKSSKRDVSCMRNMRATNAADNRLMVLQRNNAAEDTNKRVLGRIAYQRAEVYRGNAIYAIPLSETPSLFFYMH